IPIFTLLYCLALECYVCTRQDHNSDKCLHTIKVCEQEEDVCLTEIQWGTTPYWSQGAQKQYYISKRCATKDMCEKTRSKYMRYCTHIWYEDWKCSECCRGDRCNHFIITGGKSFMISILTFGSVQTSV
ncbi:hypothetical protein L9F63_005836, partial [Diploptera punctata]